MKKFYIFIFILLFTIPSISLSQSNTGGKQLTIFCEIADLKLKVDTLTLTVLLRDDESYVVTPKSKVLFDGAWINFSNFEVNALNIQSFRVLMEDGSIISKIKNKNEPIRLAKACKFSDITLVQSLPKSADVIAREVFVSFSLENRKEIQRYLAEQDFYASTIDGLWGTNTSKALLNFLEEASINKNDKNTINTLLLELTKTVTSSATATSINRLDVAKLECPMNQQMLFVDINPNFDVATLKLGNDQEVTDIFESDDQSFKVKVGRNTWVFTTDGRLKIIEKRKEGFVDTKCVWFSAKQIELKKQKLENFCQTSSDPNFWRRFDFLRDKPISIVGVDMSMSQKEIQLVLGCKNYYCQNTKSMWGIPQTVCSNGQSEITITNNKISLNCHSTQTCGLSADEITQELVKAGKAIFFDTDYHVTEEAGTTITYCSRGKAGDKICVVDNELLRVLGGGTTIELEKGNIGKAGPRFD